MEKIKDYAGYEQAVADGKTFNRLADEYCNLRDADLRNADLYNADLCGADLRGAKGIVSLSGIGQEKRFIFAYVYNNEIRIQAGCFNGTVIELIKAVCDKYHTSEKIQGNNEYMAAIELIKICLSPLLEKSK